MNLRGTSAGASDLSLEWSGHEKTAPASAEDRIAELFAQLREPLYRYLLMVTRSTHESEELTQEAFLRLYQRTRSGEKVASVKAWLFRVAHNLAVDASRKGAGREALAGPDTWQHYENTHADASPTAEQVILAAERLRQVDAAIARLSPQQRHCFHLRAEGFRYREIAEILCVRESTVTENLRRALVRLMRDIDAL